MILNLDLSKPKEILDYLNPKGEISYSDLIRDEVSSVDLLLVKDSKKAGQIGGSFLTTLFTLPKIIFGLLDQSFRFETGVKNSQMLLKNLHVCRDMEVCFYTFCIQPVCFKLGKGVL